MAKKCKGKRHATDYRVVRPTQYSSNNLDPAKDTVDAFREDILPNGASEYVKMAGPKSQVVEIPIKIGGKVPEGY